MTKTAMVTGANKGLGAALVTALVEEGFEVFAGYRSEKNQTLERNSSICWIELNVNDEESIKIGYEEVKKRTGKLDVLINNAGVAGDFGRPPFRIAKSEMLETFETNVIGPLIVTNHFIPLLKCAADPKVIMVSSILGSFNETANDYSTNKNIGRSVVYASSKAALNMASLHMKKNLNHHGIQLIVIHPGWLKTDLGGPRATDEPLIGAKYVTQIIKEKTETGEEPLIVNSASGAIAW